MMGIETAKIQRDADGASASTSTVSLCRRILLEARPYWGHFFLVFLLVLCATPIVLLAPFPLKIAIDGVIGGKPLPSLVRVLFPGSWIQNPSSLLAVACVLSFSFILLQNFHAFSSWLYQRYVAEKSIILARAQLFAHVQKLSLPQHDELGIANLFYSLQNDIASMHYIVVSGFIPFLCSIVTFASMLYVTLRLDWRFGLIAIAVLPILWGISHIHSPRSRARWTEVKETDRNAITVIQESLGAIRVVKAFGQEDREEARFRANAEQNLKTHVKAVWMETCYGMVIATVVATASATALYMGIIHVRSGNLSLGNFLVLMSYLALLFKPLENFSKQVSTIQTAIASAERVYRFLDLAPDIKDGPLARGLARAKGSIEFRNVNFAYKNGREAVHDLSFTVSPGSSIGIMGPTGAGKTTLIHLLMRMLDPTSGQILLDGTDLRQFRVADLRNQFAVVLQDSVLFSATIAENIAYGVPDATPSQIEKAAAAAHIDGFIQTLPHGYRTQVGERGMALSGGERQRIAIARAFLKNAPILVLDEPTSSVDTAKESAIASSLKELRTSRTTFMISHRLSFLSDCDEILRLEGGRTQGGPPLRAERHRADIPLSGTISQPV